MVVKKPQASRRSIHQAVAPKLEGLDPPPPRQSTTKVCRLVQFCFCVVHVFGKTPVLLLPVIMRTLA